MDLPIITYYVSLDLKNNDWFMIQNFKTLQIFFIFYFIKIMKFKYSVNYKV